MQGLELVYSPSMHGWGLSQLYSQVKEFSPTVIVIRLQAPFESAVFGAYLSGSIHPSPSGSSKGHLGDGTAFIFRLDENHSGKYEWAG